MITGHGTYELGDTGLSIDITIPGDVVTVHVNCGESDDAGTFVSGSTFSRWGVCWSKDEADPGKLVLWLQSSDVGDAFVEIDIDSCQAQRALLIDDPARAASMPDALFEHMSSSSQRQWQQYRD